MTHPESRSESGAHLLAPRSWHASAECGRDGHEQMQTHTDRLASDQQQQRTGQFLNSREFQQQAFALRLLDERIAKTQHSSQGGKTSPAQEKRKRLFGFELRDFTFAQVASLSLLVRSLAHLHLGSECCATCKLQRPPPRRSRSAVSLVSPDEPNDEPREKFRMVANNKRCSFAR